MSDLNEKILNGATFGEVVRTFLEGYVSGDGDIRARLTRMREDAAGREHVAEMCEIRARAVRKVAEWDDDKLRQWKDEHTARRAADDYTDLAKVLRRRAAFLPLQAKAEAWDVSQIPDSEWVKEGLILYLRGQAHVEQHDILLPSTRLSSMSLLDYRSYMLKEAECEEGNATYQREQAAHIMERIAWVTALLDSIPCGS